MTLFDIVKKNMKGNIQNYLLYFLSLIISVVIFYTFVSLQDTTEIQERAESFEIIHSIIIQASIILVLFVGIFIWYSNSFFTKRRKKEVGLYALLGIRKKTIGRMLFYENLILGFIALLIGILLGALFSRLFAMILLKLLDSPMDVGFHISVDAIVYTSIVFALIIILTSIQAYRLIYQFKLITLFQAEKQGEQVPKPSLPLAILSIIMLLGSAWIVYEPLTDEAMANLGLFSLFTINGTYLLFRSVIVYLLKIIQNKKTYYYKGINLIGTAQILHRIKGNTLTLTIISLLSAAALTAFYMGYSEYYNIKKNAMNHSPFSYLHISKNKASDQQIKQMIQQDRQHPTLSQVDIPVIQVNGNISGLGYIPYGYSANKTPVRILSSHTYNQITKALNRKGTLHLAGNQAAMIRPNSDQTDSEYVGHKITVQGDQTLTFVRLFEDRVINWSDPDFYIMVSEERFKELAKLTKPFLYKAYRVTNQENAKVTSNQLLQLAAKQNITMSTFYLDYRKNLEAAGLDLFLLGFLGIIFVVATGSIIYFKQLMEAHLDQERYRMIRKIGASKKEITTTIAKQTLFVYLLPLVIGILHSTLIFTIIYPMGEVFTVTILVSILVYGVIYFLYYLLSVYSYNKIVNT
ncbi:FtsX-like permease family protein [Shimazuella kribbensis]|uniref:FtsX-like permease family protein n=1 Tax=Shimazuella kribbensis TaxID=139808 RepID=UPI0003FBD4C9|nr:FtsX-like permease family protein [Shimazuella kribbensis]